MNIVDIIIAKKKSFTGETESLVRRANEAMAKANQVAGMIDDAQAALEAASSAEASLESMESIISSAAQDAFDAKAAAATAVTDVDVIDDNTLTAKIKKTRAQKNGVTQTFVTTKNYVATGQNEDGSMTQKAITDALASQKTELENKINKIPSSGSGNGNISGNITAADKESIVVVGDNGEIIPSTITEADIIKAQVLSGGYQNNEVVGLEIDYTNRTFSRLQDAKDATPGSHFDKFNMFGGRKRCIVNADGSIDRFVTNNDTASTLANKRIMVYQPAFYYLRLILSTTTTSAGIKINKEHIYLSDKKFAGFKLHPKFKDANGNPVKYILLPAFESGTLRANGSYELTDAQDLNLSADKLVSVINAKPTSGATQAFNYAAAKQMAENNGAGWELMNLEAFSINQMLMMIEYGSLNLQQTFNNGLTKITTSSSGNISANTGSTISLNNTSGQASSTVNNINGSDVTYTTEGTCSISYRGTENPFGNIWKIIGDLFAQNDTYTYKDHTVSFKIPNDNGWINAFGYDPEMDWAYLPIETNSNASSSLPVGDYLYSPDNNTLNSCVIGGLSNSDVNAGPFYYGLHINKEYNYRSVSAQITYTPIANSTIETNNYNLWSNEG